MDWTNLYRKLMDRYPTMPRMGGDHSVKSWCLWSQDFRQWYQRKTKEDASVQLLNGQWWCNDGKAFEDFTEATFHALELLC